MTVGQQFADRIIYRIEYKLRGKRKWHRLSVGQRVPFSAEDNQRYTEMLSKRHMVAWHAIELRQIEEVQ